MIEERFGATYSRQRAIFHRRAIVCRPLKYPEESKVAHVEWTSVTCAVERVTVNYHNGKYATAGHSIVFLSKLRTRRTHGRRKHMHIVAYLHVCDCNYQRMPFFCL